MTYSVRHNFVCARIANDARDVLIIKMNEKRPTRKPIEQQTYSDDVMWRGITKLKEEMAELTVELCKLDAFPTGTYPDHGGKQRKLLENVIEEMTDVMAVFDYFRETNGIPILWERYRQKRENYAAWGLKGSNEVGDHNA